MRPSLDLPPELKRPWVRNAAVGIALAAPVFIFVVDIRRFAVKEIFCDDWTLVALLERLGLGALTFGDLWAQHFGHRHFVPQLVMLALAKLSADNNLVTVAVSAALLLAATGLLAMQHRRVHGPGPAAWAAFVPIAALMLTLRQAENLLWAWSIVLSLCIFFFVATVVLADTRAAVLCAVLAAFSAASGLAVAPAMFLSAVCGGVMTKTWRARPLVLWGGVTLLTIAVYFHGWATPQSTYDALAHPGQAAMTFLIALGGSLFVERSWAAVAACALLAASIALVLAARRGDVDARKLEPWLPFVFFGVASAAMIALGRTGATETAPPNTSRFVTITAPAALGVCEGAWAIVHTRARRWFAGALSILLVGAAVAGAFWAEDFGTDFRANAQKRASILRRWPEATDAEARAVSCLQPIPLSERIGFLKARQLNVFAPRAP